MKCYPIQSTVASLEKRAPKKIKAKEMRSHSTKREMTEYLTSSITPTLGNESRLTLWGEKENL